MRTPLLLALLLAVPAPAAAEEPVDEAIALATTILKELGPSIPKKVKARADCVSAFRMGSGGFIFGGSGGTGFVSCKTKAGTWSAPVVLDIGGPSVGAQVGGSKIDLVMVYTGVDDIEAVVHATPVFQVGASATAGDKSAAVSIGGNPELDATVVTAYRSEGLRAAAVADGLAVDPDKEKTEALHGRAVSLHDTLVAGTVPVPARAKAFHAAVLAWAK
jgi:lipid-binding SYLF domain-containing protein